MSNMIDVSVALKPLQNSIDQISQALANTSNNINTIIKASLNSPLQEFNCNYSEFMKSINTSIYLPLAEIVKNINEIPKYNFEKIVKLDSSYFIEPIDTLSELVTEDNFSEQVQNGLSESREKIVSIKNCIKSDKISVAEYITLICTIISTIFSIITYCKPIDYEEQILKTLNQINVKMEQDLKIIK